MRINVYIHIYTHIYIWGLRTAHKNDIKFSSQRRCLRSEKYRWQLSDEDAGHKCWVVNDKENRGTRAWVLKAVAQNCQVGNWSHGSSVFRCMLMSKHMCNVHIRVWCSKTGFNARRTHRKKCTSMRALLMMRAYAAVQQLPQACHGKHCKLP